MLRGVCLLVLVAALGASAEAFRTVEFKNCKHTSGSPSCKVKSVGVSGCFNPSSWVDSDGSIVVYRHGETKNPCRIDKGSTLNFNITFEPGFSGNSLRSQFTLPDFPECWRSDPSLCPVHNPPEQGCQFTKCPLQRGRQQPYETTLHVSHSLSSRSDNDRRIYQMRWKLWNNKNKNNNCCLNIPVQY